jgi:NADPH:quinone reductase-like Zn-dependent oxidoreductase
MQIITPSSTRLTSVGCATLGTAMCLSAIAVLAANAATPKEQQAIVQSGTGGPEVLKLQAVPVLDPAADQVLIRVYAAAVNPTDWKSRAGTPGYTAVAESIIPGGDVAGVIEKTGPGVSNLKVGDAVFAVIPRKAGSLNGGYSQFAIASSITVVPKPRAMTFTEAAGLGIATITGVRAVLETKVSRGQRVLITGVAGGVGSSAAQAAKAHGAFVIGTASARHNAYLKSIGVDEVVDYTQGKFEEKIKPVDVVIDTVGSDTAVRAMALARKGGAFATVAARGLEGQCAAAGLNCVARSSAADVPRAVYDEVSSLVAAGKLMVKADKTFPLAQVGAAQTYGEQGHTEGKIVLIVDAANAGKR